MVIVSFTKSKHIPPILKIFSQDPSVIRRGILSLSRVVESAVTDKTKAG